MAKRRGSDRRSSASIEPRTLFYSDLDTAANTIIDYIVSQPIEIQQHVHNTTIRICRELLANRMPTGLFHELIADVELLKNHTVTTLIAPTLADDDIMHETTSLLLNTRI